MFAPDEPNKKIKIKQNHDVTKEKSRDTSLLNVDQPSFAIVGCSSDLNTPDRNVLFTENESSVANDIDSESMQQDCGNVNAEKSILFQSSIISTIRRNVIQSESDDSNNDAENDEEEETSPSTQTVPVGSDNITGKQKLTLKPLTKQRSLNKKTNQRISVNAGINFGNK